jgi:phosphonopyruvate decarboxylase
MNTKEFIKVLYEINNAPIYMTGVPDSLLAPLLHSVNEFSEFFERIHTTSNEGNAVGMAAGYNMATQKVPFVYLQNSGLGNIVNPVTSLISKDVYDIPMVFIVGWRGAPGYDDEPQHKLMGLATEPILKSMDMSYLVLDKYSNPKNVMDFLLTSLQSENKRTALLVKTSFFDQTYPLLNSNSYKLSRYEALETIFDHFNDAVFVATTGKTSREIFEIRERRGESHENDFLNVGAMGHTSSIALGIALVLKEKKVICIDGDGSLLMHLGSIAKIAFEKPKNFVHIVIDNMSHESVGGFYNSNPNLDLRDVLDSVGYKKVFSVESKKQLVKSISSINNTNDLSGLIIRVKIGSKVSLGRPNISPDQQKIKFIDSLIK